MGATLLGWVAVGLPYWFEVRTREARFDLIAAGFTLLPCDGGETCLIAWVFSDADQSLSTLAAANKVLNITALNLSGTGVTSLEPLAGLTRLRVFGP